MPSRLRLGGLTALSATDFPGVLSAVLFLQGCPWRCAYCHNPHLISVDAKAGLEWEEAVAFLRRRVGLLDAVVFSGGEPTLQEGLEDAVREVKDMGFLIGLHTAGAYPDKLGALLPLIDWVGLDIKAPFGRYGDVNGAPGSGAKARISLRLIVESGVDHECRTTVHPALFTRDELAALSETVFALGARRHVLQAFRAAGCRDESLNTSGSEAAAILLSQAAALSPRVELRGA